MSKPKISVTDLSTLQVELTALVIALGSNANSEYAFAVAMTALGRLGGVESSSLMVGQDFTGQTKRIYHNACVCLTLAKAHQFIDINQQLKNIEKQCGRTDDRQIVPMDLDILAVCDGTSWHINSKKTPFKNHEQVGVQEVAKFLLS